MNSNNEKSKTLEDIFKDLCKQSLIDNNSSTMGIHNMSPKEVMGYFNEIKTLPASLSRLSLPKRLEIPEIAKLKKSITGNLDIVIDVLVESGDSTNSIAQLVLNNQAHLESLRAAEISRVALETQIIATRFQKAKSLVFTLRNSLSMRLADLDVGMEIPVKFIRPPFDCCYIEFCEAESRQDCTMTMYGENHNMIVEGAYCLNYNNASLKHLSQAALHALDLDRTKPARIIEICFTGSPYYPKSTNMPPEAAYMDMCELISLIIQDEDEPLHDVINRHIQYSIDSNKGLKRMLHGDSKVGDGFKCSIFENLNHLLKSLIYINSDLKTEVVQSDHANLLCKIASIKNPKKLSKLNGQLKRSYDRVLLGPATRYTPLNETLDKIHALTGVKPHVRRGYFGIRWTGTGRVDAKSTWIKPAIINANSVDGIHDLLKDYLVF
jgi:hypothetical protein